MSLKRDYICLNIKINRLSQKLSQQELANKAGFPKSKISKIENKNTSLPIDDLFLISKALNISPQDLFPPGDISEEELRMSIEEIEKRISNAAADLARSLLQK